MAQIELDSLRRMGLFGRDTDAGWRGKAAVAGDLYRHGDFDVEIRPLAACEALTAAWQDLAERAVEPNLFLEPAFALTAAQHLREAQGAQAVLVWARGPGGPRRLAGLWIAQAGRRLSWPRLTRGFATRYSASGVPLLDRSLAVAAAAALLGFLAGEGRTALFPQVPLDGAAARALRAAARLSGQAVATLDAHRRACVWPDEPDLDGLQAPARRHAKEQARLKRRLADLGAVRVVHAREPAEVKAQAELFLAQEASGWKARRGTAILMEPRDAAFFRTLLRRLARRGQAEVSSLECDGLVAATGLVLTSGGQGWFLKTSHDEALARFSPGALLAAEIGRRAGGAGGLACLDSCAFEGHAMIERVWKGRIRVGDLAIGCGEACARSLRQERLRRAIRAAAKAVFRRAMGYDAPRSRNQTRLMAPRSAASRSGESPRTAKA